MLVVGFQGGWDREFETETLNRAVAFEPGYYHYYRRYAEYLKPQWYGENGEIEKYAEQASLQLRDPDASMLYFRITSSLACNCSEQPGLADATTWALVVAMFAILRRRSFCDISGWVML